MDVQSKIHAAFAAAEKGAALIYHDVVAAGHAITDWGTGNPAMVALVEVGLNYATGALTRFGLPGGVVLIVAEDIIAALKHLAALDSSMPSAPMTSTIITSTTVNS